jgi:hypothetical protein
MTATTIDEVIEQLNEIVMNAEQNSGRAGYFAALYKRVTVAVADKIKAGYFDDNARMEKLDVLFANRYLDAYHCYTNKQNCTASWKLAFDTTKKWPPLVVLHLLAGMNAHISLDLGIAAATIAPGNTINDLHNDFCKINVILNELVDEVKAELFEMWPPSKFLIQLNTGKLENTLASFSMTIARDAAWQVALDYAPLQSIIAQQNYIALRDNDVMAFGKKLMYPGLWLGCLFMVFKIFEFRSISSKVKMLSK